eukprot:scaffold102515_cov63-Attheya_sp.AAC.2
MARRDKIHSGTSGPNPKWRKAEALSQPQADPSAGYSVHHALIAPPSVRCIPQASSTRRRMGCGTRVRATVNCHHALYTSGGGEWEIPAPNEPSLFPGSTMLVGPLNLTSEIDLRA